MAFKCIKWAIREEELTFQASFAIVVLRTFAFEVSKFVDAFASIVARIRLTFADLWKFQGFVSIKRVFSVNT